LAGDDIFFGLAEREEEEREEGELDKEEIDV
jgi:hypothetical protein